MGLKENNDDRFEISSTIIGSYWGVNVTSIVHLFGANIAIQQHCTNDMYDLKCIIVPKWRGILTILSEV